VVILGRNILMFVAAIAVAAPLCAQESDVGRASLSSPRRTDKSKVTRGATPEAERPKTTIANTDKSRTIARGAEPVAAPAVGTAAGSAPAMTLAYLSQVAQENHPVLRRDRARIESAAGSALQAGLYPNPRFDTNNPEEFAGKNSAFNVGFQQDFVTAGKLRLDKAAALRAQQQSEFTLTQDRFALLTSVRSQFYTTLAAQVRVEVLNRLLKITEASVKTAKERVEALIGDRTEVKLLEIDYNKIRADLTNAQRILDGERRQLAAVVGLPGLVQGKVQGMLTSHPPTFDEEILQQFVTSENAMVQIAKIDIDRNKVLLKRAEVEPIPNINLGPAYQWGLTKGAEQYWLTVTFPIPVSDRNQGNIMAARANVRDATETLGVVQLELLRRVADAYSRHRGALEQAERYRTNVLPDSFEALRLAKSGYDNGVFEFAAYLQAQRTVMDIQRSYVDILETVWTTAADLAGLLQMEQFPG